MVSRKGWFKTRMRYVLLVNYYLCGLSSKGDESESDAKRSSFENEKGGLEWEVSQLMFAGSLLKGAVDYQVSNLSVQFSSY